VVDIKTCHLQEEPTNKIRVAIKDFALANGYSFYDIREHKGFMRTVQLRICPVR
jgi:23S rRNA (uracil1939-C5)-methyltransferase